MCLDSSNDVRITEVQFLGIAYRAKESLILGQQLHHHCRAFALSILKERVWPSNIRSVIVRSRALAACVPASASTQNAPVRFSS